MLVVRCLAAAGIFDLAFMAHAQITHLATNGDGSMLYLSTPGRLKGTSQPLHGKIFRLVDGAVKLVAAEQVHWPCGDPYDPYNLSCRKDVSNAFDLALPQVSDDGKVTAWTGTRGCRGDLCDYDGYDWHYGIITRAGASEPTNTFGIAVLSRNGQYAAATQRYHQRNPVPYLDVWDLEAGESIHVQAAASGYIAAATVEPFGVSDQGVAIVNTGVLSLVGKSINQPLRQSLWTPMIDRSGSLIAGRIPAYLPPGRTWNDAIGIIRLVNGVEQPMQIIHSRRGKLELLGLTGDGMTVLFSGYSGPLADGTLGPQQLFVIRTDGSGLRQITDEEFGVGTAAMSSDGRVVWYVDAGAASVKRLLMESGESGFSLAL